MQIWSKGEGGGKVNKYLTRIAYKLHAKWDIKLDSNLSKLPSIVNDHGFEFDLRVEFRCLFAYIQKQAVSKFHYVSLKTSGIKNSNILDSLCGRK